MTTPLPRPRRHRAPATPDHWLARGARARLLWPLSVLYGALAALDRLRHRVLHVPQRLPVPVVVVGNVVAGGAGKTPTTLALVRHLRSRGWRPGVISRGYGRETPPGEPDVRAVPPDASARWVGDEPLLIARQSGVPVFVGRRRAEAGQALLAAYPHTDILVCDDGLQHHALGRDLEICVFDERGIGNGWLLPAGPLREPWPPHREPVCPRLVLHTGQRVASSLAGTGWHAPRRLADYALRDDGGQVALQALAGRPLAAVAGIARPQAFFDMLAQAGLQIGTRVPLPDHDDFSDGLPPSCDGLTVLCTEKDAVKLWPVVPGALAVPMVLDIPSAFWDALDKALPPIR
ncbi:tetraacyldisaccharide 4'-kinase [Comamonadaceae bacterium PP-2]